MKKGSLVEEDKYFVAGVKPDSDINSLSKSEFVPSTSSSMAQHKSDLLIADEPKGKDKKKNKRSFLKSLVTSSKSKEKADKSGSKVELD